MHIVVYLIDPQVNRPNMQKRENLTENPANVHFVQHSELYYMQKGQYKEEEKKDFFCK